MSGSNSANSLVLNEPTPVLYVSGNQTNFNKRQHADLVAELTRLDESVTLLSRPSLIELQLGPNGATEQGGYRYTWDGFSDVCRTLSQGLSSFLSDLSGMLGRHRFDLQLVDVQAAIGVFNMALQLRHSLLQDKQVILDVADGTLDGVVGMQHRFLRNVPLLDAMDEAAKKSSNFREDYYGATIMGRRLVLYYRSASHLFELRLKDRVEKFYLGHYLCNGESGRMSLRGASGLYGSHGVSLGPFSQAGTVVHVGNAERQSMRLINRLFNTMPDIGLLDRAMQRLARTSLNLAGNPSDRAVRLDRLRRLFTRRKVSLRIINELLENTIWQGSDAVAAPVDRLDPIDAQGEAARLRTSYDLYCSLLRLSRRLPHRQREHLAQVAYDLLLEKFRLT